MFTMTQKLLNSTTKKHEDKLKVAFMRAFGLPVLSELVRVPESIEYINYFGRDDVKENLLEVFNTVLNDYVLGGYEEMKSESPEYRNLRGIDIEDIKYRTHADMEKDIVKMFYDFCIADDTATFQDVWDETKDVRDWLSSFSEMVIPQLCFDFTDVNTSTTKETTTMSTTTENSKSFIVDVFSIVKYKGNYYLVGGFSSNGAVKLINLETGKLFSGTPSVDKVTFVRQEASVVYNNVAYCYSVKTDKLYTARGIAFENKANSQRQLIVDMFNTASNVDKQEVSGRDFSVTETKGKGESKSGTIIGCAGGYVSGVDIIRRMDSAMKNAIRDLKLDSVDTYYSGYTDLLISINSLKVDLGEDNYDELISIMDDIKFTVNNGFSETYSRLYENFTNDGLFFENFNVIKVEKEYPANVTGSMIDYETPDSSDINVYLENEITACVKIFREECSNGIGTWIKTDLEYVQKTLAAAKVKGGIPKESVSNKVDEDVCMTVTEVSEITEVELKCSESAYGDIGKKELRDLSRSVFMAVNAETMKDVKDGQASNVLTKVLKEAVKISMVKDNTMKKYVIRYSNAGIFNDVKFFIAKDDADEGLFRMMNSNIHLFGVTFASNMTLEEVVVFKIAAAMLCNGIGYEKVYEGISKGYKIFPAVVSAYSKTKQKHYKVIENWNHHFKSVGPLGEGHTTRFVNPNLPIDGEFGQNVQHISGSVGRLAFEKPNKLVAREMKLGAGKTDGITELGSRTMYVVDAALNDPEKFQVVEDMLVLGTAWVSEEEYYKLGSVRIIPTKAVTAPLARKHGLLMEGEMIIGGNSFKSGLNGLLSVVEGMSHLEISKLNESEARDILSKYIALVKIKDTFIKCYKVDVSIKGTNFYSLYGIEGTTVEDNEDEDGYEFGFTDEAVRSFFTTGLGMVEEHSLKGEIFDLQMYLVDAFERGVISPKKRMTTITSAELQQVALSYGFKTSTEYADMLITRGNVASKYYLNMDVSDLPVIQGSVLNALVTKHMKTRIDPTIVPEGLYNALCEMIGNIDSSFAVIAGGYKFPFTPIGEMEIVDGYVKDVNLTLSALLNLVISIRNEKTRWAAKFNNHMLELNGVLLKKVQALKVRGSYLAAVTGYWLEDNQVFSNGDKPGRVTSAKLPILFDQSVTSMRNTAWEKSPYSFDEIEKYQYHFGKVCFVSPIYFLSQENDGDGDLVKISKGNKAIPYWKGQPSFTAKVRIDYAAGEYNGLKLKLKPYSVYEYEQFDDGNMAAYIAKSNVAIMASNEYRVKECMIPVLEYAHGREYDLARMIAEGSAYIVQYMAMRAAKHSGTGTDMYGILKCAPKKEDVLTFDYEGSDMLYKYEEEDLYALDLYVEAWTDFIGGMFGKRIELYDNSGDFTADFYIMARLLTPMYLGEYNALSAYDSDGLLSMNVNAHQVAFALMQKGHARAVGAMVGQPNRWEDDEINRPLAKRARIGSHNFVVFNTYVKRLMATIDMDEINSVFVYVLKRITGEPTVSPEPENKWTYDRESGKYVCESSVVSTTVDSTASAYSGMLNEVKVRVEFNSLPEESEDSSWNGDCFLPASVDRVDTCVKPVCVNKSHTFTKKRAELPKNVSGHDLMSKGYLTGSERQALRNESRDAAIAYWEFTHNRIS